MRASLIAFSLLLAARAFAQAPAEAPKAEAPVAAPAAAEPAKAEPAAEAPKAAEPGKVEEPAKGIGGIEQREAGKVEEAVAPKVEVTHGGEGTHKRGAEPALPGREAGGLEPSEGSNEKDEHPGIVNWFSWDYGANAKEPSHKHWPAPFGFALINFAIFLFILSKLLFKPIGRMAAERHERIKTDLEAAAKLRAEAEAKLVEYQKRVANVDAEIDQLVSQLRTEAQAEKARIVAAAEAEAKRLREDAEKQIEMELVRVRGELRQQLVDAVVAAASTLVQKNLGAEDQKRIADRYVVELERGSTTKGAQS